MNDDSEGWTGRAELVRLGLRFVGIGAFGFVLIRNGLLAAAPWVVAVTALGWVLMIATSVLRSARRVDAWSAGAIVVMMLCGAVVNPQVDFLGTVFFVAGGMILVGQPDVPLRTAVVLLGVTAVITVAVAGYAERSWAVVLAIGAGTAAIALFGALRRQTRARAAQDRALAARTRELEVRNAELVAQTEATRRETARVAALSERSRIARDLHDVLAHALGGLIVQLEAADAELAAGEVSGAAARLAASRRLAVDGLRDARAAVRELRAEPSDDTDPVDVVAMVTAVLRGPVGLHLGADLEVVGEGRPVPRTVGETLAAVTREALTNVNKHAPGSRVAATLVLEPDAVRLEVVNGLPNGTGRSATELAGSGSGTGLVGMAERVTASGGRFSAGAEGRRWVVSAWCPIG